MLYDKIPERAPRLLIVLYSLIVMLILIMGEVRRRAPCPYIFLWRVRACIELLRVGSTPGISSQIPTILPDVTATLTSLLSVSRHEVSTLVFSRSHTTGLLSREVAPTERILLWNAPSHRLKTPGML